MHSFEFFRCYKPGWYSLCRLPIAVSLLCAVFIFSTAATVLAAGVPAWQGDQLDPPSAETQSESEVNGGADQDQGADPQQPNNDDQPQDPKPLDDAVGDVDPNQQPSSSADSGGKLKTEPVGAPSLVNSGSGQGGYRAPKTVRSQNFVVRGKLVDIDQQRGSLGVLISLGKGGCLSSLCRASSAVPVRVFFDSQTTFYRSGEIAQLSGLRLGDTVTATLSQESGRALTPGCASQSVWCSPAKVVSAYRKKTNYVLAGKLDSVDLVRSRVTVKVSVVRPKESRQRLLGAVTTRTLRLGFEDGAQLYYDGKLADLKSLRRGDRIALGVVGGDLASLDELALMPATLAVARSIKGSVSAASLPNGSRIQLSAMTRLAGSKLRSLLKKPR